MKCGCKMISDTITFSKHIISDERSFNHIELLHKYQQYVNVCGECGNKAKHFNNFEKVKLNIAKEQFKVLCDESVEEPEPELETND